MTRIIQTTDLTLQNILCGFFRVVEATLRGSGLLQRLLVLRCPAGSSRTSCTGHEGPLRSAVCLLCVWLQCVAGGSLTSGSSRAPGHQQQPASRNTEPRRKQHLPTPGGPERRAERSWAHFTWAPRTFTQLLCRCCQASSASDVISVRPSAVIPGSFAFSRQEATKPLFWVHVQLRSRWKMGNLFYF